MSAGTLAGLGLVAGQRVRVSAAHGSVDLPVGVADLPEGVVWTPTTSTWSAASGSDVRLAAIEGAGA